MIRKIIKQELEKINDLRNSAKPISFVFFNSDNDIELKIREVVIEEFDKVKNSLKRERENEIKQLIKEKSFVKVNYSNLLDRYSNTSKRQEILEWKNDAEEHEYNYIISEPTKLKEKADNIDLRLLHLTQHYESIKKFEKMNENMDFTNLKRYSEDKDFKKYYKLTDEEAEYENLRHSTNIYEQYLYCYGIDLHSELYNFDSLFHNLFKWDKFNWSVFNLNISKADFEKQASEFLKTELYDNRKLVDAKNNQFI